VRAVTLVEKGIPRKDAGVVAVALITTNLSSTTKNNGAIAHARADLAEDNCIVGLATNQEQVPTCRLLLRL